MPCAHLSFVLTFIYLSIYLYIYFTFILSNFAPKSLVGKASRDNAKTVQSCNQKSCKLSATFTCFFLVATLFHVYHLKYWNYYCKAVTGTNTLRFKYNVPWCSILTNDSSAMSDMLSTVCRPLKAHQWGAGCRPGPWHTGNVSALQSGFLAESAVRSEPGELCMRTGGQDMWDPLHLAPKWSHICLECLETN